MKDWVARLRIAYVDILDAITYNSSLIKVFYEDVPIDIDPGTNYIIVSNILSRDDSDKNSFDGTVSVLVSVVSIGTAGQAVTANEDISRQVKGLINADTHPDLSPFFKCHTTEIISDEHLSQNTEVGKVFRRLIRYQHFIEQINFS